MWSKPRKIESGALQTTVNPLPMFSHVRIGRHVSFREGTEVRVRAEREGACARERKLAREITWVSIDAQEG